MTSRDSAAQQHIAYLTAFIVLSLFRSIRAHRPARGRRANPRHWSPWNRGTSASIRHHTRVSEPFLVFHPLDLPDSTPVTSRKACVHAVNSAQSTTSLDNLSGNSGLAFPMEGSAGMAEQNQAVKKFRAGGISASIWRNERKRNGEPVVDYSIASLCRHSSAINMSASHWGPLTSARRNLRDVRPEHPDRRRRTSSLRHPRRTLGGSVVRCAVRCSGCTCDRPCARRWPQRTAPYV